MDRIENIKLARRKRISEEIAAVLMDKGLSRKEFADKMGRAPSEVTKWLGGKHNFTSDLLAEISEVLGTEISGADIDTSNGAVSGYSMNQDAGSHLEDGSMEGTTLIEIPPRMSEELRHLAKVSGTSLRDYVYGVLKEEISISKLSAKAFYGILDEDYPDAEELRAYRTKNTFPEL